MKRAAPINFNDLPPAEQARIRKQLGRGDDPQKVKAPGDTRKPPNPAEELFLELCRKAGIQRPHREYSFAVEIGRQWRLDFAFDPHGKKITVELEGVKDHASKKGLVRDIAKGNALTMMGWRILRYTYRDLKERPEEVMREVMELFDPRCGWGSFL